MINQLLLGFAFLPYLTYVFWKLRKDLHMTQLNSYRVSYYGRWISQHFPRLIPAKEWLPFFSLPLLWMTPIVGAIFWLGIYTLLFLTRSREKEKKKLQFTTRAKRLFIFALLLAVVLLWFGIRLVFTENLVSQVTGLFLTGLLSLFSFGLMFLANFLIQPLEGAINQWYYRDAQKRVREMSNLTVIGITGSYGKTSTKYFLSRILAEKFNVLMTPESYNTPMGVTKVIRTQLRPVHEVFVVEMGARRPGDIVEICRLVGPKLGVLTAIGPQHLETFKDIRTIQRTKNELITSLPEGGIAFYNMDNPYCHELGIVTATNPAIKTVFFGMDAKDLHYRAQNLTVSTAGTSFEVVNPLGEVYSFQTRLLGRHNIYNILAALAVATELGMDLRTALIPVKTLESVPHRLELKRTPGGVIIIDDAFNSNPVGAGMALDVLSQIAGKKKILVTPGMVELGDKSYECNYEFGIKAAKVCDYVILVGETQTLPIQEALKAENFTQIFLARNFNDANAHMQTFVGPGDVVLFENDLPDTYNE